MDLRCKVSHKLGVLITGSTGFVGRELISSFGVDDFVPCKFEDADGRFTVIHLAANVSNTREAMLENIAIDSLLLENVNLKHRALIYASTNNVYPYSYNCTISERLHFNDYYATAKIVGEKLISDMSLVPSVSLRIADVFGVGQRHGNLFKAIEHAIRLKCPLTQYGDGGKRRSYLYVPELANMIKFIVSTRIQCYEPGAVLNLGYSDDSSVAEILKVVSDIAHIPILQKQYSSETSKIDFRTMSMSNLFGYKHQWSSFNAALTSYVNSINN